MICDTEPLYMYLLAILMSSLGKCVFRFCAHFLIGFGGFAIDFYGFFIFLYINPLSDT